MKLFFLRHGAAEDQSIHDYPDDSVRPLTSDGKKEMRIIGKGMLRLGLEFGRILSSPYLRAKQTAEIVAQELRGSARAEFSQNLIPGASPENLLKEIRSWSKDFKNILLVSHEPFLSHCLSFLLSGNPEPFLVMKKGGLCKIKVENRDKSPQALLKWLLTPSQLAEIGHR
jgi:phosphohistidine phosphatase